MKIGFFTGVEGWGGSEMYLGMLMQGIRDRGHEPVLVGVAGSRLMAEVLDLGISRIAWRSVARYRPDPAGVSECTTSNKSAAVGDRRESALRRCLLLPVPVWAKLIAGNLRETLALRRIFGELAIDVLHVNVHGYEVAGLAARMARIPSVAMYCTWPEPLYGLRGWLTRGTSRGYTVLASKSGACLAAWLKALDATARASAYVYNGVDIVRFSPAPRKSRHGQDPLRLISVGRLHPSKGFDVLLRALARVQGAGLTILGDGPARRELQILSRQLGISDRVVFAGEVSDPVPYYQASDCFALCSRRESFGQVVVEAMACGLPVITSDFGPLPELNIHGETGFVVKYDDVPALSAVMERIRDQPEFRLELGAAARARAVAHFTYDSMIAAMETMYREIQAGRPGRANESAFPEGRL